MDAVKALMMVTEMGHPRALPKVNLKYSDLATRCLM